MLGVHMTTVPEKCRVWRHGAQTVAGSAALFCRSHNRANLEGATKAQHINAERIRIVSTPDRAELPPEELDSTEKPEPGEHVRAAAKEMARVYEDRPTAVLPGSDRMVTSTAVNDRLDDDGEPIYGNDNKSGGDEQS
jgi:hypothetical protein